jgi:hypothetical protein
MAKSTTNKKLEQPGTDSNTSSSSSKQKEKIAEVTEVVERVSDALWRLIRIGVIRT